LLQGLSEELSETLKKETVKTEEDKARWGGEKGEGESSWERQRQGALAWLTQPSWPDLIDLTQLIQTGKK
jgi:hypothetical protein